jgi:hypothetical protein
MKPGAEVFERFVSPKSNVADQVAALFAWGASYGVLQLYRLDQKILWGILIFIFASLWFLIRTKHIAKQLANYQLRQDLALSGISAQELFRKTFGVRAQRSLFYPLTLIIVLLCIIVELHFTSNSSNFKYRYNNILFENCVLFLSISLVFPLLMFNGMLDWQKRLCRETHDRGALIEGYIYYFTSIIFIFIFLYITFDLYTNRNKIYYLFGNFSIYFKWQTVYNLAIFTWIAFDVLLALLTISYWRAAVKALYEFE